MAYYNSIKTLLNNGKTFSEIYTVSNKGGTGSSMYTFTLNNSKDGFSIGDYIMIWLGSTYVSSSGAGGSVGYLTVTGCTLILNTPRESAKGSVHCPNMFYIGQIKETNINISVPNFSADCMQVKVFKLSNNS